jgi:hypothetical protein
VPEWTNAASTVESELRRREISAAIFEIIQAAYEKGNRDMHPRAGGDFCCSEFSQ